MSVLLTWILPQNSIQSDRIQGMARYMNGDGAAYEWFSLGAIFVGMFAVIMGLKFAANRNSRKQEEALRKRMAKNRSAKSSKPVRGHARRVS